MPLSSPPQTALPSTLRIGWTGARGEGAAEPQVRAWLAQQLDCPAVAVPLVRDALGRPQLCARYRAFDVNWSHSGDGLLVGLGDGLRVGVDVEHVRPRPRAMELAQRFFAADEVQWLAAQPASTQQATFLRLWCAKEAVLKAHGRGLAFGLQRLQFAERDGALKLVACERLLGTPDDWSLHEFEPAAGFRAAIAWRAGATPH
jgi:4'-phosphopantetheinyl transferase